MPDPELTPTEQAIHDYLVANLTLDREMESDYGSTYWVITLRLSGTYIASVQANG